MISLYPAINQVELPPSRTVAELGFSWSIRHALASEGIQFEAELAGIPDRYLLKIPNIGVKAVKKIRDLIPYVEVKCE